MTGMQRRQIPVFAWYYKGEVVAPPDAEVVVVLAADAEAAIAAARRDALSARIREVKPYADGWVEGQRDMLAKVRELLTETRVSYKAKVRWRDEYRDGAADALLVVSEALDYDERFTNGQVTQ